MMSTSRLFGLMAATILVGLALLVSPAFAEKRVALVIGNGAYKAAGRLANPVTDARDMASALRSLGFQVDMALDVDRAKFETAISDFSDKASGADVALVFYAGHGMGLGTETHLLPVDADFRNEFEARNRTIGLTALLGTLEGRAKTVLAFVDACRDNPLADRLAESMRGSGRTVSVTRGLARIEVGTSDTLVVYATTPGRTAADGTGRNSPFTTALLAHLGTEGVEIEVLLKRVSARVQELTGNKQEPERLSRLKREFYFKPAGAAPVPPGPSVADPESAMRADFAVAQTANSRAVWQAFIDRYRTGFLVDAARDRLHVLGSASTPSPPSKIEVASPPPAKAEFVFSDGFVSNPLRVNELIKVGERTSIAQIKNRFKGYNVRSTAGEDCLFCATISGPAGSLEFHLNRAGTQIIFVSSLDKHSTDALGNRVGGKLNEAIGNRAECDAGDFLTCKSERIPGLVYIVDTFVNDCHINVPSGSGIANIPECSKILGFMLVMNK